MAKPRTTYNPATKPKTDFASPVKTSTTFTKPGKPQSLFTKVAKAITSYISGSGDESIRLNSAVVRLNSAVYRLSGYTDEYSNQINFKELTDYADASKNTTSFSKVTKPRSEFALVSKPRVDFSKSTKPLSNYLASDKPETSYSSIADAGAWFLDSTFLTLSSTNYFLNGFATSTTPNQLNNKTPITYGAV